MPYHALRAPRGLNEEKRKKDDEISRTSAAPHTLYSGRRTFEARGGRFWLVARNGRNSTFNRGVTDECRQFRFWISPIFCHPYQYKIISD